MQRLLLSLFLLFSISAQANSELLPADKAFSFNAKVVDSNILLSWNIADGYYLYKEKIKISSDYPALLGAAKFPVAKIKNDEFFGKIGIYRHNTSVSVPILAGDSQDIELNVSFQGCADLGVCYPPITKSVQLKTEGVHKPSLVDGAFDVFTKAQEKMRSLVLGSSTISAEPLSADEAFAYSALPLDANTLRATWQVHPEYYLYHDKFSFTVSGADIEAVKLPKWQEKNDPYFGKTKIHKGEVSVDIVLKNIKSAKVSLRTKFQGCWLGGICYPPQEKNLDIVLPKTIKSVPVKTTKTQPETVKNASKQTLNEADKISVLLKKDNIWLILASFFGFGLLLSLTPCVFPMIPILSGIIVGQKGAVSTKKALAMSAVFVLSVSLTYALAGVLAGYFGENLQILLQTPAILALFSAVFVALAFSMFGFYDIQLPSALQNKIANISNKQESGNLLGVAIMGVLSALIVGPCVAPPLAGALIYIGQTGDALLGGLSLFVMSLGMGMPLLLIGTGVSKLPKAGGWMENIKAVFGVIMLAVAIYLLERIIPPLASLILWALLFTLSPIAMGAISFGKVASVWHRIFKGIGLLLLIYGILLWGLVARGGGDMLAPLSGYGVGSSAEKVHIAFEKIKSVADLERKLAEAQSNQVVILDFYADWCVSCKELERYVFSNPKVVLQMQNVVALQADVTANDEDDKALMKHFGIIGPPGILLFKNSIENRSQRIIGEIDAQGFLQHLNNSKQ
ncbi:MAG: protein-disulfide reductase DsbD [Candidatus Thioglobus sp.]|nr:MAG: protein-disulfide reductase DsbD [Candidatus Thioglobus sp.]